MIFCGSFLWNQLMINPHQTIAVHFSVSFYLNWIEYFCIPKNGIFNVLHRGLRLNVELFACQWQAWQSQSRHPGIQATVTLCHCHRWSQWVQLCVPQTQFCLIQMFVRSNLAQTFHNHNSFPLFNLTASLQPLLKSNDFWSIQTKPNVYWISLSFLKKFSIFSSFFNS